MNRKYEYATDMIYNPSGMKVTNTEHTAIESAKKLILQIGASILY